LDTIWTPSVDACLGKAGLAYVLIANGLLRTYGFAERLVNHLRAVLQLIFRRRQIFVDNELKGPPVRPEVEPGSLPNTKNDPPKRRLTGNMQTRMVESGTCR
jgi:hypothetical protein